MNDELDLRKFFRKLIIEQSILLEDWNSFVHKFSPLSDSNTDQLLLKADPLYSNKKPSHYSQWIVQHYNNSVTDDLLTSLKGHLIYSKVLGDDKLFKTCNSYQDFIQKSNKLSSHVSYSDNIFTRKEKLLDALYGLSHDFPIEFENNKFLVLSIQSFENAKKLYHNVWCTKKLDSYTKYTNGRELLFVFDKINYIEYQFCANSFSFLDEDNKPISDNHYEDFIDLKDLFYKKLLENYKNPGHDPNDANGFVYWCADYQFLKILTIQDIIDIMSNKDNREHARAILICNHLFPAHFIGLINAGHYEIVNAMTPPMYQAIRPYLSDESVEKIKVIRDDFC